MPLAGLTGFTVIPAHERHDEYDNWRGLIRSSVKGFVCRGSGHGRRDRDIPGADAVMIGMPGASARQRQSETEYIRAA
jgi:hypothetical protein